MTTLTPKRFMKIAVLYTLQIIVNSTLLCTWLYIMSTHTYLDPYIYIYWFSTSVTTYLTISSVTVASFKASSGVILALSFGWLIWPLITYWKLKELSL